MARDNNVIDLRVDSETGEIVEEKSGKTLEQIAEEVENAAEEMPGFVRGSNPQLTLDVGGKKPTGSELKVKGGSWPMLGQFPKNKRATALITFEVEHIHFKTERDRDRLIVGHTRVHQADVHGILVNPLDRVLELVEEHGGSEDLRTALIDLLG